MNKYRQQAIITALSIILMLCPLKTMAQVPVSLSPVPHLQFLSNNGTPLANGCVFTYQAGTTTPAMTYVDSTGTGANTNPIILNAGGFADIWLPNAAFKFKVVSAGGVACASGTTQWTVDNISGVLGLLNLANTWTAANTFSQPVTITPNTNQLVLGTPSFQTTLNAPAPAGNITINLPSISGTLIAGPNPVLTAAVFNGETIGGVSVNSGNPTNFVNFTNGAAGTTTNQLAKLVPLGSGTVAVNTLTSDTGGVVGIVIANAGVAGINITQRTGQVLCVFDGSTTVDDYVQISSTNAGNCHDTGLTAYPSSGGQIIGRVLTTNVGAGTYLIDLFPPEIRAGGAASVACTNFTPVTITNNNTLQSLLSCTIPANALAQGSLLSIDVVGLESSAAGQTITIQASVGGGTSCLSTFTAGVANLQPYNYQAKFAVLTAGAGGTANISCEVFGTGGTGVAGPFGTVGAPTIAVNTTIINTLQISEQMSVLNAGNSVTGQFLKAVIY